MKNPPDYLNDRAKEIFDLVLPQLGDPVLYSDVLRLAAYSQSAAEYEDLTSVVQEDGATGKDRDGEERRTPDALARAKAFDQWCKSEISLGLERKQRVKFEAAKKPAKRRSLRKEPRQSQIL